MLFNTLEYLIFFSVVIAVYFMISHKYRWILLLAASYYFYMCWKAEYIILIIASTLIDYFCGIQMSKLKETRRKKIYLLLSLLVNLGLLFSFKYFNFFNDSLRLIFNRFNIFYNVGSFKLLLPVGISFYTFQTLSYTIEVYKGTQKAEKHLGIFALYVAFFPQLVAGPIERAGNLLPQFYKKINFDYDRVVGGLRLIAWGLVKKIVIADRLAVFVNHIYNQPQEFKGLPLIVATIFFAFQIFCDFSGYSDIAIGSARILGIDLMKNFRRPYFSKSIAEFWSRWHISLSTWFRDYVYIPLGGNRVGKTRFYINLFVTFLLSGLWHGANWTFVIWGMLHAGYMIVSKLTMPLRKTADQFLGLSKFPRMQKHLRIIVTFFLVCFAWIFFRANSLSDALYIITNIFNGLGGQIVDITRGTASIKTMFGYSSQELLQAFAFIIFMEVLHLIERNKDLVDIVAGKALLVRWIIYVIAFLLIIHAGQVEEIPFIYFQF